MRTKVIPMDELKENAETIIRKCCDSGQTLVVELSDRRRVTIQPSADDDDDLIDNLIATNQAFRDLLVRSAASGRKPFPFRTIKKPSNGKRKRKRT